MPDRIRLSRAKGWRKPPAAIVVTRATIFGNPWRAGSKNTPSEFWWPKPNCFGWFMSLFYDRQLDASMCVELFRDWMATGHFPTLCQLTDQGRDRLAADMAARRAMILSRLPGLRGHDLCCTCKPGTPCHADLLLELANQ